MNYSKKATAVKRLQARPETKEDESKQIHTLDILDFKPPVHIKGLARKWWIMNVDLLSKSDMLKATDMSMFEACALAYGDFRYWVERIQDEREKGTWQPHEEVRITTLYNKATKVFLDLCSKLGMTSVDRARVVRTNEETDEDEFSKYE